MNLLKSRRRPTEDDLSDTDTQNPDPVGADTESSLDRECDPELDPVDAEAAERSATPQRRAFERWRGVSTFGVIPILIVVLAAGAGYLKWQNNMSQHEQIAMAESVKAAGDATVAMLSYKPDTVEQDLDAARGLLTGPFLDSYTTLTRDVVIPGALEKQITATASIPAAASVSVDGRNAVVLLFVNQTISVGAEPPTNTASTVRVSLEQIDGRWLVTQFDPI